MTGKVPFFGSDREFAQLRTPLLAAAEDVLRTGKPLQGQPVDDFEQHLAAHAGRRFAVATGSCTDSLAFALLAAGIGAGDEVLVPDLSFVPTASSVRRIGAIPVFVDIDDAYGLDLDLAATAVNDRTAAVVYVQLYGAMRDADPVEAFARRHGLALIEDAAQAFGAVTSNRAAGSVGVASCYSFDPTKVLAAPGSGGAVLTDDPAVAEAVRQLRWHGVSPEGFARVGYNSQMSSLVAAMLTVKLEYEPEALARRRAVAARYSAALVGLDVDVPSAGTERMHVFHKYVIRTRERAKLTAALDEACVEWMIHYPYCLHQLPFVAQEPHRVVASGRAEAATRQNLSLPMHAHLSDAEVDRVGDVLRSALQAP